ncbi:MAG: RidA family protein [Chloroflexi bacterium]|nr:RidA family protein [Chloroflexota bacterium]
MDRTRISSGSRWEGPYGYSRAIAVGDACWVAGTTDPSPDHAGNAALQARTALQTIERALVDAGFGMADVVRTRMYVTDPADATAVASVHGEVFTDIRPAATLVVVAALIEPGLLVEIEADAVRAPTRGPA